MALSPEAQELGERQVFPKSPQDEDGLTFRALLVAEVAKQYGRQAQDDSRVARLTLRRVDAILEQIVAEGE